MESCSFVSESYVNDLKHCSFLLPHDYIVPDALRRVSPMEFSNVLTLSAEIFESLQHSSQTIQFQDLLKKEKAKLEKEKAKVEKDFETKESLLLKNLEYERADLTKQYESEQKKMQKKIDELQGVVVSSDNVIDGLRKQLHGLQETLSEGFQKTLEAMKQDHREEVGRIQSQYQDQIGLMKESMNKEWDLLRESQAKAAAAVTAASQKNSSAVLGAIGEKEFDVFVNENTQWLCSENVSKSAHSTDRLVKIHEKEVRCEIKNYSNNVPYKEVDKFFRDLQCHPETGVAFFVSLKTGIVGKEFSQPITCKWTPSHQLCIFLHHFQEMDASIMVPFMELCVDMGYKMFYLQNKQDEDGAAEDYDNSRQKVVQMQELVQKELKHLVAYLLTLGHDHRTLCELIQKQYNNSVHEIQLIRSSLESMLAIAGGVGAGTGGGEEEVGVGEEAAEAVIVENVVVAKPKKQRKTKGAVV